MRIYEINTRCRGRTFEDITQSDLTQLARLGFDCIWLMGVWRISAGARRISKLVSDDFEGSPYAVPNYKFNPDLGGKRGFQSLVRRAHKAELKVVVDFVSNHMALDSPWIGKHPEFFVRGNTRFRKQATSDYFLHKSGEVIAFGRDPYFPPWHDTSQLDYTCEGLRSQMIAELKQISRLADGVRCDMAMLLLRDYIRQQWFPLVAIEEFNDRMPAEFWGEAIAAIKAERPPFTFIAEAYWDKEEKLRELGFDLTYEKKLYDGLVARDAHTVAERISFGLQTLRASLYFIENHDEPRAAALFSKTSNLASAALILTLPGSVLIHEGQMEGYHEKLPVQRVRPLMDEPPDLQLRAAYEQLLEITSHPLFRNGDFQIFNADASGVISFIRKDGTRVVAYMGQVADENHRFNSTPLTITSLAQASGVVGRLQLTNLLNAKSIIVQPINGEYRIELRQTGVDDDTRFCLLEARCG